MGLQKAGHDWATEHQQQLYSVIQSNTNLGLAANIVSGSLWPIWTVAHQAPLFVQFPRREYQSGLPFLPPGDLPEPGIEAAFPALVGRFFTTEPPGKPQDSL